MVGSRYDSYPPSIYFVSKYPISPAKLSSTDLSESIDEAKKVGVSSSPIFPPAFFLFVSQWAQNMEIKVKRETNAAIDPMAAPPDSPSLNFPNGLADCDAEIVDDGVGELVVEEMVGLVWLVER